MGREIRRTDTEQRARFLRDPKLFEILLFHKYSVEASLDNSKILTEVLKDLYVKVSYNDRFVEISPEDLGMANPTPWETNNLDDLWPV